MLGTRAPGDGCSPSSSGQKGNLRGYPSVASNPRFGNGLPNGQAPRGNARPSLHNVLDAPLNPSGYATAAPGRLQPGQPPPASSAEANTEIRCVCGHNKDAGDMIQCEVCPWTSFTAMLKASLALAEDTHTHTHTHSAREREREREREKRERDSFPGGLLTVAHLPSTRCGTCLLADDIWEVVAFGVSWFGTC